MAIGDLILPDLLGIMITDDGWGKPINQLVYDDGWGRIWIGFREHKNWKYISFPPIQWSERHSF